MPNWMIRGVTVAGWLVLERWITPYLFAITTCHLEGDFCRYPDDIGDYPECDFAKCKPVLEENPMILEQDYPRTEAQLTRAFDDPYLSSRYLEHHYESFLTKKDIVRLHDAGVTHLKVPMPHLSKQENKAWLYFVRLVSWCRDVGGLHVWPDVRFGGFITSENNEQCWLDSPLLINRTLEIIHAISFTIMRDGLRDVVTGFGLHDVTDEQCHDDTTDDDKRVLFYGQALNVIRSNMGHNTSILVTGTNVTNCDEWWNDTDHVHFNVISKQPRAVKQLSPRQQIAYVCRHANTNVTSECNNTKTIVAEWSTMNTAPTEQEIATIMHGIQYNHTATYLNRTFSKQYKKFLKHVSQAHMVTYEQSNKGWFYGNVKVEGGAFAEHDFLRGIREGWIPKLNGVGANESCEDVLFQQHDDMSIIQENPFLDSNVDIDEFNDDLVRSHGDSVLKGGNDNDDDDDYDDDDDDDQVQEPPVPVDESDDDETLPSKDSSSTDETTTKKKKKKGGVHFFTLVALAFFAYVVKRVFFSPDEWRRNRGYSSLDSSQHSVTIAV